MPDSFPNEKPIPEDVLALFGGALRIGYLSTIRPDGDVAIVPIGIMVHDGKLRISSPTRTRKVANLGRDPRVSVCITDPEDFRRYVSIRGVAELADDVGREFINWLARTHMGQDEYPYESPRVARTIITIRPTHFVTPVVQGSN
jgi:PPOX class probable F420-dependent enzyme